MEQDECAELLFVSVRGLSRICERGTVAVAYPRFQEGVRHRVWRRKYASGVFRVRSLPEAGAHLFIKSYFCVELHTKKPTFRLLAMTKLRHVAAQHK